MNNFVHIQGLHIKNFKALADVKMGRLWNEQAAEPLTPITTVIGKNGTGKSSLMDAFGFLADCLKYGVEIACDEQNLDSSASHVVNRTNILSLIYHIYDTLSRKP